jgi:tetratricopeptide (TPR) repeat protein
LRRYAGVLMRRYLILTSLLLIALSAESQLQKISIPAGTPEDKALQAAANEADAQKKLAMYQDVVRQFGSNPDAVAFADWQISQYYQNTGDMDQALEFGDQALAATPRNLDILVSQASVAQQKKDNARVMDYAVRGGEVYAAIGKQARPEGMSDQDFASRLEEERAGAKASYEFLEAAAFNVIASQSDARARMGNIERFTPAFPNSRFDEQVASYAMISLSELKDTQRLISYGEKTLQTNPNSLPTLLLLAGAFADDPKPGSLNRATSYAQKAIEVAKADAPDADRSRKLSGGIAHATLGYALMKQDKTPAAAAELKTGASLLKGTDDQQYAIALYRLGYAYAKLNKVTEAREALLEAAKIPGPVQQMSQDLLTKVNAARAKAK